MDATRSSLSKGGHELISIHHALHPSQVLLVLVVDIVKTAVVSTGWCLPMRPVIVQGWPVLFAECMVSEKMGETQER